MTKLLEDYSDVEISNGFHDPTQTNECLKCWWYTIRGEFRFVIVGLPQS